MNKMILSVSAAALLGLSSLAGIAPAAAQPSNQERDQRMSTFCDQQQSDTQCKDWKTNRTHWSDTQYRRFYSNHRSDSGFNDSAAAGLFGFAIGTAVGGALNNGNNSDHVRACEHRYRSYDVQTDTYFGSSGVRHRCRL